MSSENSSIDADNLDVDEGAVIQSAQPSIYDFINPSVISEISPVFSDSPEQLQFSSKSLYKAVLIPEKKPKIDLSIEDPHVIENSKADDSKSLNKNFVKKNIEKMQQKNKKDINIDDININELCLEGEGEKREQVNVDERFYKYQNKVNEKIQNLAKELKEKEMEGCTFKPDVKNEKQRRTTDQFINEMINFEKIKNDKLEVLRSQKKEVIDTETKYHPVINQKSKDIVAKKGECLEPIYEKLYKAANKPNPEKSPPKHLISKASSTKRAEPVDKILYEDALRRAAKSIDQKPLIKESQVNLKSQQVLAQKFTKEFNEVISALNIDTEKIDKFSAIKSLICLNFIRDNKEHPKYEEEKVLVDKLFKLIGGGENIQSPNLLKICLAILNIHIPSMTCSDIDDNSQYGIYENEIYSITKANVVKVHKLFSQFYENRQLSQQLIKQIQAEEYSFKPQISAGSEAIAKEVQKRAGSLCSQKREEFIQQEKKKTLDKIEKLRKEKEEEEAKLCTFKPNILKKSNSNKEVNSVTLYERSKQLKERKEQKVKTVIDQEIEKNMSECTFAPKLEKIKVKEERDVLHSKSVQQQLLRMQKAREEQERKKQIL